MRLAVQAEKLAAIERGESIRHQAQAEADAENVRIVVARARAELDAEAARLMNESHNMLNAEAQIGRAHV